MADVEISHRISRYRDCGGFYYHRNFPPRLGLSESE
jgi:hypothetical protein